jgi:hypothetical protein
MGVDGFMLLALEGGGDGGEVVAVARAGELEGALDGGPAGRRCLHDSAFRAASGSSQVSLSRDACGLDQVMRKGVAGRRPNSEGAAGYWQSLFQAICVSIPLST